MKPVSLADLASFKVIAAQRSFRKAALELGVSPSALSHTMRQLETQLGVRLLQRTTRSVAVTEAGEALLARLKPALLEIEQALETINDYRSTPRGSLRLSVPPDVPCLVLVPYLTEFLRLYPDIQLEIISSDQLLDIVEQGFDAGIRYHERLQADMVAVPFCSQQFVVVAAPTYLAKYGIPSYPNDLLQHECIRWRFSNGELYRWQFRQDDQVLEVEVSGHLTTNHPSLIIAAAHQGLGCAYLLKSQVQDDLRTGRLVQVLETFTQFNSQLFLYHPSRKQQSASLSAFIDFWRERQEWQEFTAG